MNRENSIKYVINTIAVKEYDIPFKVYSAEDIIVYYDNILKTPQSDYELFSLSDGSKKLRLLFNLQLGKNLILQQSLAIERYSNFNKAGNYSITVLNGEFDKIYEILNQLDLRFKTTLRIGYNDDLALQTLPVKDQRVAKLVTFNDAGDVVLTDANSTVSKLVTAKGYAPSFSARAFGYYNFQGANITANNANNLGASKNQVGSVQFNFNIPMTSNGYSISVSQFSSLFRVEIAAQSATGFLLQFYDNTGRMVDPVNLSIFVFD